RTASRAPTSDHADRSPCRVQRIHRIERIPRLAGDGAQTVPAIPEIRDPPTAIRVGDRPEPAERVEIPARLHPRDGQTPAGGVIRELDTAAILRPRERPPVRAPHDPADTARRADRREMRAGIAVVPRAIRTDAREDAPVAVVRDAHPVDLDEPPHVIPPVRLDPPRIPSAHAADKTTRQLRLLLLDKAAIEEEHPGLGRLDIDVPAAGQTHEPPIDRPLDLD